MKKLYIGIIATVIAIGIFTAGIIAGNIVKDIKAELHPEFVIEIDGDVKEFKNAQGDIVYPIVYDGTTYLPVRAIGEIMGKTVYWFEDEKRIELKDEKGENKTTVTDADVIVTNEPEKIDANNEKNDKVGYISEETAKKIALEKAGLKKSDVRFDRVEFERDNGIYIYDVEFRKGYVEYNAEIKADDGKILEWDVDIDD